MQSMLINLGQDFLHDLGGDVYPCLFYIIACLSRIIPGKVIEYKQSYCIRNLIWSGIRLAGFVKEAESMSIWDKDVESSFDSLFDLNNDGKLDPSEQSLQLQFLYREGDLRDSDDLEEDEEEEDAWYSGWDDDDDDEDEDY